MLLRRGTRLAGILVGCPNAGTSTRVVARTYAVAAGRLQGSGSRHSTQPWHLGTFSLCDGRINGPCVRKYAAASAADNTLVVGVPEMGDSITEGSIAAVLKSVGDSVAADDVIVQIETDKVTIDVRAPCAGVIQSLQVKEGDTVLVGQAVLALAVNAASAPAAETVPAVAPSTSTPRVAPPSVADIVDGRRKPSIKFPTRRLADGTRVVPKQEGQSIDSPSLASAPYTGALASAHPARPALSKREMMIVELGGAEPYPDPALKKTSKKK